MRAHPVYERHRHNRQTVPKKIGLRKGRANANGVLSTFHGTDRAHRTIADGAVKCAVGGRGVSSQ